MLRTTTRLAVIGAVSVTLAACGGSRNDDVVVVEPVAQSTTPIFSKDGRVIGQRPTVSGSSDCANGMTREEDLQDGDIDCSN